MPLNGQLAIVSALALMSALPAQADTEAAKMALPAVSAIFSSHYVAQDAGIYRDLGLDMTEQLITGVGAANAVIAGAVDFANSSGVTLTRAAARGQPVIAIAGPYDRSGFWILINKKIADERHFDPKAPLAERAKILKGLRFGVGGIQTIPHAYLKAIVAAGGLDPDKDIIVAGMAPPEEPGAMQRNAIDGASTGPPQLEVLRQNGAIIVANGTSANPVDPPWLSHVAANVVLVKKQTCAEHKSLCAKMGQAMVKAAAYMHEHAKETMAILAKRLNINDQSVLEDTYKETLTSTPLAPVLDAKGLETADQLNVAAGFMSVDQKLPSYEGIFTNEYVK